MSLSDSLWAPRLWIPAPRSGCPTQEGIPGSSADLSPRAAPNHHGESGQVLALCFPASVRLPPHGGTGHSLLANEAESDSLFAAAHGFAPVRLRRLGSLHPAPHRATCRKSNYMVDSFHSTRSARLILAHPCVSMRTPSNRTDRMLTHGGSERTVMPKLF